MPFTFPDATLVIGHRGARRHFPENTIPSFAFATTIGADMVECDLRKTADGTLVIFHDASVARHLLRTLTYDELCALLPQNAKPPLYEDLLRICRDSSIKLDLEFKEAGYEEEAMKLLRAYLPPDRVIITSFKDEVLKEIHRIAPDYTLGLLIDMPRARSARQPSISMLARMTACGASVLAVQKSIWRMRKSFMKRLHAENIPVLVWTANQQRTLRRALADPAVRGVITDRPEVAHAVREAKSQFPEQALA